jgi:hypothetical protein
MTRRVYVHKANLNAMGYDSLEHWMENPQHVYVRRNVVYVAGARQPIYRHFEKCQHVVSRLKAVCRHVLYR